MFPVVEITKTMSPEMSEAITETIAAGGIIDYGPHCIGCGKYLAILITRPWAIKCSRCKRENLQGAAGFSDNGHDQKPCDDPIPDPSVEAPKKKQWVLERAPTPITVGRLDWRQQRCKQLNSEFSDLRKKELRAIREILGEKCAYCGSTQDLAIDHIKPLREGGWHTWNNIQILCISCNSRKHTKEEDYRKIKGPELRIKIDEILEKKA